MINLMSGNPWGTGGLKPANPASFSRFILPFSYTLQAIQERKQFGRNKELYFKSIPTADFDRERIRYFTSETAEVLYGRAVWGQIPEDVWDSNKERCGSFSFNAQKSGQTLLIKIAQPWVVLFEGRKQGGTHELLQNGFLILETYLDSENRTASLDDMLEFNDLFRFFDIPYTDHFKGYVEALSDFPSDYSTGQKISYCSHDLQFLEYKNSWLSLLRLPLYQDDTWYSMVPAQSLEHEKKNDLECHLDCGKNKCLIYADNRAFVWTCAIVEKGAHTLCEKYSMNVEEPWESGHWLRLLNVDSPGDTPRQSHSGIKKFEKEWLKKRTYLRWTDEGTYYGYCYHSGAMLAPSSSPIPLWFHFGQMYFDQIVLLFYLRITLFAFSRDLTYLNDDNEVIFLQKEFKNLRHSFAKFTNLYQFPLISNQQQGVEMYDIARTHMDIEDLFNDVKNEITSTHEFLAMNATEKLDDMVFRLTIIGLIIALFALPWEKCDRIFELIGHFFSCFGVK
ncbi:MAG TPA: hypothetical protein EYG88_02755 [Desulfocapsa sulfexigens]|nr:hypothetical protein [Desulfocapsa sulfexigens]